MHPDDGEVYCVREKQDAEIYFFCPSFYVVLNESCHAYLRAHRNIKCIPPVLIHRAITCDIFKVLAQNAEEEVCDNNKKDPKSYYFTSGDPRHAPGQNLCTTVFYSLLPLI